MRVVLVTDELSGRTVGERIQIIRERTGKSRPVVAGLVGRSAEWLSTGIGRRLPPRLGMLIQLSEVLGVRDLGELIGEETLRIGLQRRGSHDVVPAIREAIEAGI
jgi:transcriptional regulator with XRE-family HTH domain